MPLMRGTISSAKTSPSSPHPSTKKPVVGRSRPFAGKGFLGAIPDEVWSILDHAWAQPFHISGNYAREKAIGIAFAASMGWLSNITPGGEGWDRKWHITAEGLMAHGEWKGKT